MTLDADTCVWQTVLEEGYRRFVARLAGRASLSSFRSSKTVGELRPGPPEPRSGRCFGGVWGEASEKHQPGNTEPGSTRSVCAFSGGRGWSRLARLKASGGEGLARPLQDRRPRTMIPSRRPILAALPKLFVGLLRQSVSRRVRRFQRGAPRSPTKEGLPTEMEHEDCDVTPGRRRSSTPTATASPTS